MANPPPVAPRPPLRLRLLAGLRVEHLLLVVFLAWYISHLRGWYLRLGDALLHTNLVGISWVSGPALVLILILVVRHVTERISAEDGATPAGSGRALAARVGRLLGDWLPFFLFLSIYSIFRSWLLARGQGELRDAELAAWEEGWFGGHLSLWMERWVSVPLTAAMQLLYLAHIVYTTPTAAVVCYLRDIRAFRAFMLGLTLVAGIGAIGYARVPAAGPGVYLHARYHAELPVTVAGRVLEYTDANARSPNDVFPSLHVAVSLLCLLATWRASRRAFWWMLPFVLGNWVSTVYLRYHYVVDCIAGAALALFAHYAGRLLVAGEERLKRLAGPPAAAGDPPQG